MRNLLIGLIISFLLLPIFITVTVSAGILLNSASDVIGQKVLNGAAAVFAILWIVNGAALLAGLAVDYLFRRD